MSNDKKLMPKIFANRRLYIYTRLGGVHKMAICEIVYGGHTERGVAQLPSDLFFPRIQTDKYVQEIDTP